MRQELRKQRIRNDQTLRISGRTAKSRARAEVQTSKLRDERRQHQRRRILERNEVWRKQRRRDAEERERLSAERERLAFTSTDWMLSSSGKAASTEASSNETQNEDEPRESMLEREERLQRQRERDKEREIALEAKRQAAEEARRKKLAELQVSGSDLRRNKPART